MKSVSNHMLEVLLITFLTFSGIIPNAYGAGLWPEKSGDVCWKNNDGDIIRLSAENMRNKHYLVHGTYTWKKEQYVQLLNGNAEIVGDRILMNISSLKCAGATVCGSIGSVDLDGKSLNGSAQGISLYYEKQTGKNGIRYDEPVHLDFIQCP